MNADVVQFLWRRVLRIFPAFLLVLVVGAAVVGPIAWLLGGRPLSSYLTLGPGGPVAYVVSNADLVMRQWGIHDIFIDTPYGQTVDGSVFNGSLWTLTYEFSCYLIIAVLVLFGVLKRARLLVLGITVFYLVMQIVSIVAPGTQGQVVPAFADGYTLKLGLIFLIGSTIALYSRDIPFHDGLALLSFVVVIATLRSSGWTVAATIVLSAGCAWLSWHGVEKHALALKDWGPGRGVRHWVDVVLSALRGLRERRARRATDATAEPDLDVG
jgi:peptidoglycan/LPS O-acetylase OafA/YrhL